MKIKKVISACLVLTCLATGLSGCGKTDQVSDTADRSVIKLGSDSYPPYNYLNEDGVPTGIDVELATEAFGRLGYDVEIVNIDWERKQEMVERQSAPCKKFVTSVGPSELAPYMTARWEMDLSPGTEISPRRGRTAFWNCIT